MVSEKLDHSTAFVQVVIGFQYLEEYLRMYLERVFRIIATATHGKFPFKYDYHSLEKDSLGKLVDRFEHFTDNDSLTAELRKIVPERNKTAHQGFLIGPKDDESEWARRAETLQGLHEKLQLLLKEVGAEVTKLERIEGGNQSVAV